MGPRVVGVYQWDLGWWVCTSGTLGGGCVPVGPWVVGVQWVQLGLMALLCIHLVAGVKMTTLQFGTKPKYVTVCNGEQLALYGGRHSRHFTDYSVFCG